MQKALGIDIGGTKIAAGIIDESFRLDYSVEIPSIPHDSEKLFRAVVSLIEKVLKETGYEASQLYLGLGIPGLVDSEKGIAVFQNNLSWDHFPIVDRLRVIFPEFQTIVIENDVYQAAFAEWHSLHLSNKESLAFFTVSTGISSPIIVNGKNLKGQGFAGEVGLLPVNYNNQMIRLEDAASGPAIAKAGQQIYGDTTLTTADVFFRYYAAEPQAIRLINEIAEVLAQGVYALISLVNPSTIVFGGSVMKKNPVLLELVKEKLKKKIISIQATALERLLLSSFENNAGLIGAGLCALKQRN